MSGYDPIGPLPHHAMAGGGEVGWSGPGWYAGDRLASVWQRLASAAIDYGVPLMFVEVLTGRLALLVIIINSVVLQGLMGQSVGKRLLKTQMVRPNKDPRTGFVYYRPPGMGRCFLRLVGHIFDLFFFIGFFLIAFGIRRASIGDKLAGTLVLHDAGKPMSNQPGIRDF